MATQTEQMRTPKSFWVNQRGDAYSDWTFGFWRELFQNEVDAGAKRIDITISDAEAKGSFGRDPDLDKVVRVTFQGDGGGMDERVLRDVFLTPGESTKREGGFQGGFGTARVMLCFSQARYSVRTQDWLVEGDGNEFTCMTVPQALQARRTELAAALEEGATARIAQLRADMAALEGDTGYLKGCRLEIDVDPQEFPESYRNVDARKLAAKLAEYVSVSQLGCKVFLNGKELEERTLKGAARRKLVATLGDGSTVEFATVHTSMGERARFKGEVIVRSSGATMYKAGMDVREQVVVELDPALSRKVLTQTRDGLKDPYSDVLYSFLRELAVDTTSALKDKDKRKHIKIEGGKGALVARLHPQTGEEGTVVVAGPPPRKTMARYTTREEYVVEGYGGAPAAVVDGLLRAVAAGEATFLPRLAGDDQQARLEVAAFSAAVQGGQGAEALRLLGGAAGTALAETLLARATEAGNARAVQLEDMHDVHIQIDDIEGNDKLKQAVRRYKPDYWRRKGQHLEGRGMKAHMLLAAWTSCCEEAVGNLLALRPDAARSGTLDYSTGFYFGKSERRYVAGRVGQVRIAAQNQDRDGVKLLLINPVDDEGQPAIDLAKDRRKGGTDKVLGIQDLEALACEEVAHILEPAHDEDYAMLLRDLMATFNRTRAHERMRDTVAAVGEIYGRGQTLIQSMEGDASVAVVDIEEEEAAAPGRRRAPRPAQVIMAHAAPLATVAAGVLGARENAHIEAPALRASAAACLGMTEDGVTTVDCGRLQVLETGLSQAADADWNLEGMDLPSVADIPVMEQAAAHPEEDDGMDLGGLELGASGALPVMEAGTAESVVEGADLGGLDLGGLDLGSADDLPVMGSAAAAVPAETEDTGMDLGGLDYGAVSDLPEMGDALLPPGTDYTWQQLAAMHPELGSMTTGRIAAPSQSDAERGAALVGEELEFDLGEPGGPGF